MKLNIEELTRAANDAAVKAVNTPSAMHEGFDGERLRAFARLIVERCAVECENTPTALTLSGEFFSERCANRVRNLLEAE